MSQDESFRDSIGTINKEGKRSWIYAKKPSGKFYEYRKIVSYVLLAMLFSAPFIKVDGNQLFLFNVLERKFHLFGYIFWPQDFHLVVIMMIIGVVFVTLFTVAYGRLFCGWVCPQTIFLEMVFRRIEYWIEGDRGAQIRLDKAPWDAKKIRIKGTKWLIFFIISFLIANVFLAYLIGSDRLLGYISQGPAAHQGTLISLLIFTGVFYFVFTWFREQVCIIVCPYGRLQGVLLDQDSIVVAYDEIRGEKIFGRAKFKKNEDRPATGKGDCIDCAACVHVCPTGIDIRNGTQLECVNCTACIDACDQMMDAVGMDRGLIRYASESQIKDNKKFHWTPKLKGYTAVLVVLIGVLSSMLFLRNAVEARILRLPGQLYQTKENGVISNVYTYKLVNKTNTALAPLSFKMLNHQGMIYTVKQSNIKIDPQGMTEGTLFIDILEQDLSSDNIELEIGVFQNEIMIETTNTTFLGPKSSF